MTLKVNDILIQLKAAQGKVPVDLLITNVKIVNVYTEQTTEGSIAIKNGKIVAVNPQQELTAENIYDAKGQYAIPGLMDAHVHIEPTLLTPEALASLIVPHGTTTMFVDAMEIANVAGVDGLKALLSSNDRLPYRIYLEVPSRVPTAPGLETTGGVLGLAEVEELLQEEVAVSLGELDPSKVLNLKEEYLQKVLCAQKHGKVANGHAIGLTWDELNVYTTAGLNDDHECVEYQELLDRVALGITVMIREGSTERNLQKLIKGVVDNKLNTEHLIFCTDDKHANDISKEGHINYNVNKAISLGLSPIKAIKIATLNCARHFRMDHLLGSITPGRLADIILTKELENVQPSAVFKDGSLVSESGKLLQNVPLDSYPEFLNNTVKLSPDFNSKSLAVPYEGTECKVKTINIYTDQIINYGTDETLPVQENCVVPDPQRDILKLAVVERYGKNGGVGVAFVKGFGLKKGALAISVSHDHHNIVTVGCNDQDMYMAAKEIEKHGGGLVVANEGQVVDAFPLPIAGLMSNLSAEEVLTIIERLNSRAKALGCKLPAPFMTLSFISLPTVPELGLTDKGLIDVRQHKVIPLLVE
ncbi:MAG: adenine deaminase [Firmicutes bacterium]|nr:adenine deaminase [Bacillota bacterium]